MQKQSLIKHIYQSIRSIPSIGFIGATKLLLARYFSCLFSIHPKRYPAPITIRGKTSDARLLYSIIVSRAYDLEGLTKVRTILDAGANIGLATIYFAKHFPEAKITSIEPETSNFILLKKTPCTCRMSLFLERPCGKIACLWSWLIQNPRSGNFNIRPLQIPITWMLRAYPSKI